VTEHQQMLKSLPLNLRDASMNTIYMSYNKSHYVHAIGEDHRLKPNPFYADWPKLAYSDFDSYSYSGSDYVPS